MKTTRASIRSMKLPMETCLAALSIGKLDRSIASDPRVMTIRMVAWVSSSPAIAVPINETLFTYLKLVTFPKMTVKAISSPNGKTISEGKTALATGIMPSPRIGSIRLNSRFPLASRKIVSNNTNSTTYGEKISEVRPSTSMPR
ncbi:Uncharacterised protein [Mycobacteroides abscessus subsp. abscessus]|nr:Uncharacterised protein [Mycobacteroides abscessus subsp. abscessus]